jgi:3-dehydroquinate synthase
MIQGLAHMADVAAFLRKETELYVVYDENVASLAREVLAALPVKGSFGLKTSEERKTLETVQGLCRQLLEAGASRNAYLLAIGGGITTDMTGFAAAIYKRGIRYSNLPTTLLAQVDAAIGGKTGVNLDGYKNMLGAFRMPEYTFLCADVLKTLPPRELRAGLAELLKTFLIGDAEAYEQAVRCFADAQNDISGLITKAAQIKAGIVAQDPEEHGIRAKLNLGHTFGHAIEHEAQRQGDDIHHGEAVAMGIILAARLSEALGVAQKGLAARLKADFEALGLPVESPYPLDALRAAMEKDKKAAGGQVNFVLLQAPGKVVLRPLTPAEACNQLSKK